MQRVMDFAYDQTPHSSGNVAMLAHLIDYDGRRDGDLRYCDQVLKHA
jgi:hypothetical protein